MTLTNGSTTFTDASAVATDVGEPVTSGTADPGRCHGGVGGFGHGDHFGHTTPVRPGTVNVTFPNAVDSQPPGNQLSNGFGTPDFAISSRAAKTTKGNCALAGNGGTNDELACDTFWGVAADGVQVLPSTAPTGASAPPA